MSRSAPATALVLAVVAVVLGACGDDAADDRAVVTTRTAAAVSSRPSPLNLDRADLAASKTYTTHYFQPTLTFTTGPGDWYVENRDTSSDLSIGAALPRVLGATIGWHRVTRVFDPARGGMAPSDQVALKQPFADWLTHHPRLKATAPKPVEVAGLRGVSIDVTSTSQPPRVPHDCGKAGPRCVPLFHDGQDTLTYARGDRGRFTILTLPGGGELTIEQFASPGSAFARVLRLTAPTLETLKVSR